jgi:hypothetical protein
MPITGILFSDPYFANRTPSRHHISPSNHEMTEHPMRVCRLLRVARISFAETQKRHQLDLGALAQQ